MLLKSSVVVDDMSTAKMRLASKGKFHTSEFPPLCQQYTSHGDTFVLLEGSVYPHQATLIPRQISSLTEH